MATEIDLDALQSAARDDIIRVVRGSIIADSHDSTDEDWPSLVLQIPTLIAAIRERDIRIAALTNTPPPTADLVALVREIAASDPWMSVGDETHKCGHCGLWRIWSNKKKRWEYDAARGATKDVAAQHLPDCHWVQARAIVARLDGGMG